MKQTQGEKHSIAWFKIAEYVSRGEKERALGVYRLLSHSFNDQAIAYQLQADIHLAFDEQEFAIILYTKAMELYQKSQRFLEAAAICEHLVTMSNNDMLFRREAIKLYHMLANEEKMRNHIEKSLSIVLATGQDHYVQEYLAFLRSYGDQLGDYALEYMQTHNL
jgi:tetratricopeptide (TPR) repeat protein